MFSVTRIGASLICGVIRPPTGSAAISENTGALAVIGAIIGVLSLLVAIVSAIASARSAAAARESASQARAAERRAILRDVVVASQGVAAELKRMDFLAAQLRTGYRSLLGLSGGSGSRASAFLERVDERVHPFAGVSEEANRFAADVSLLHEMSSDDLMRAMARLETARIRAQHIREEFEGELASVNEEIRPLREKALRG